MMREKSLKLMPVNVYVDPEKSGEKRQQLRRCKEVLGSRKRGLSNRVVAGVRVSDVAEIVVGLFKEEIMRRWPVEFVTLMLSFQPIGALARVG